MLNPVIEPLSFFWAILLVLFGPVMFLAVMLMIAEYIESLYYGKEEKHNRDSGTGTDEH